MLTDYEVLDKLTAEGLIADPDDVRRGTLTISYDERSGDVTLDDRRRDVHQEFPCYGQFEMGVKYSW